MPGRDDDTRLRLGQTADAEHTRKRSMLKRRKLLDSLADEHIEARDRAQLLVHDEDVDRLIARANRLPAFAEAVLEQAR